MAGTGRISLSYSAVGDVKSTHQYKVTAKFEIGFNYGGYNNNACPWSMNCAGQSKSGSSSFSVPSGGGSWNYTTITTQTFTITMDKSGTSKTVSVSASISTGVNPATISASKSITLPAVNWINTITYNANGGSGAPPPQSYSYGNDTTLSSTKPTRTGYTFLGWSLSDSATSPSYSAGQKWGGTNKGNYTLYAVWKLNTYTVSYNANGGSGAPPAQTKTYGKNLTLSNTIPTRQNYNFLGWSINQNASTAEYSAAGTYSTNSGATLYAVWELAYWAPKITNVFVHRCTDTGVDYGEGTYAMVEFRWECCQIVGVNNVRSIVVEGETISASGTNGNVNAIVGGNYSIDNGYVLNINVTDSKGGASTYQIYLESKAFTIDFKAGGKGVAIGKPADKDNLFDVGWNARIGGALIVNENTAVLGTLNANGGLTIDKNPVNDYVIAQGRSGIWTYRKWNSGFAECWCTTSNTIKTDTKWGNVYYSIYKQGGYALPFTFVTTGDFQDYPQGIVTLQSNGGNYWFQVSDACTTTNAPKGYVMSPVVPGSALSIRITFYVRGRWKK